MPTPPTPRCRSSAVFDGANDYLSIPSAAELQSATAMTVEAWGLRAANGTRTIVERGLGAGARTRSYDLRFESNGAPFFAFTVDYPGGPGVASHTASELIPVGQWAHLAMTFDSAAGEASCYINGYRVARDTTGVGGSLVGATMVQSASHVTIGAQPSFSTGYFADQIDQVRIWSTARSERLPRSRQRRLREPAEVPALASLRNPTAITIEAWARPLPRGGGRVLSMGDGVDAVSDRAYDLGITNGQVIAWSYLGATGTGPAVAVDSALRVPDAEWSHLAATYDSTSGQVRPYVNGVFGELGSAPPGQTIRQSTHPLDMGATPPFLQSELRRCDRRGAHLECQPNRVRDPGDHGFTAQRRRHSRGSRLPRRRQSARGWGLVPCECIQIDRLRRRLRHEPDVRPGDTRHSRRTELHAGPAGHGSDRADAPRQLQSLPDLRRRRHRKRSGDAGTVRRVGDAIHRFGGHDPGAGSTRRWLRSTARLEPIDPVGSADCSKTTGAFPSLHRPPNRYTTFPSRVQTEAVLVEGRGEPTARQPL
ncbi:MAG: LamG domain-containing protein [Planctomycetes bacterium]|nr:LamG domain-containing protein [Planctomycetota bacterium]